VDELTREELISIILELRERVAALEKENAELRARLGMGGGTKPSTPEWVKPNRAERAERKKREQSFVRKRDVATREVRHGLENCPDCGRKLSGGWIVSRRQTIEKLLEGLYGVHISLGEITEILHKVSGFAEETVQCILRRIRGNGLHSLVSEMRDTTEKHERSCAE